MRPDHPESKPVRRGSLYGDVSIPEPYGAALTGKLRFRTLDEAENSIRALDQEFQRYSAAGDSQGSELVRSIVLKGRRRAEGLAASPKVRVEKRCEKAEIALWFKIWLQTPELFFDWLEIRKQSSDFKASFPNFGTAVQRTES